MRRDQVAAADLRGIDPEPAGQHVERPLDQVGGLRAAGAAVGLVRRGVRERAGRVGVRGGDVVGPHDHRPGERRGGGPGPAEVGARVVEDVHVAVAHPPVALGRDVQGHEQVAAVGGGLEVLGAGREPAHRPAELQRQPGDQHLLGVEVRLGAEPAADLGGDGPEPLLRDPQDARHARLDAVRGLGGGPHRHPVAVQPGRDRPRLHGARDEPLDPEIERDLDLPRRRLGRRPSGWSSQTNARFPSASS